MKISRPRDPILLIVYVMVACAAIIVNFSSDSLEAKFEALGSVNGVDFGVALALLSAILAVIVGYRQLSLNR